MDRKNRTTSALSPDFLRMVSHGAGVYIMKDKGEKVLYVGKARNLRRRLSSYIRFLGDATTKTGVLLSHVDNIATILTATEKEALILESSLIKRHKPKYNIILRDDKNYPFIKITVQDNWPRLLVTRRRLRDGAKYFGPFAAAGAMWETIRLLNRLFPLRRCKGKNLKERQRPCLNYQMKRCPAPCANKISRADYQNVVKDVLLVLGGRKELLGRLRQEMRAAAASLEFERAAGLRDKIAALEKTVERQIISADHHLDQDVFAVVRQSGGAAVAVLLIRDGLLNGQHAYFIPNPLDDDRELMAEVLCRFYDKHPAPDEIVLPMESAGLDTLAEWLIEQGQGRVKFRIPQRGSMVRLIEMAEKNARQVFVERISKKDSWHNLAARMQKALGLLMPPERITCIDISNIGGSQTVGSVVNYWQGEKDAAKYRHYKIPRIDGLPDDYASMAETLERHLRRAATEDYMPNLLLVDGGKGQLNVARRILVDLGMDGLVELAGIAKDKGAKGERIYRPGRKNPLDLPGNSDILLLFMRIRDEAHRFGITFHRKWRNKEALTSPLDAIPGIGPAKKKTLLKTMGSLKRIKEASLDDLAAVPGIGLSLAQKIQAGLKTGYSPQ